MSDKITQFAKFQKYRFDFGTDDKLYTVIFNAKIPQAELKGLISSLQNCLYEKIPGIIPLYLKQHHLEHSNFNSIEIPLEYHDVMEWAGYLLHSDTYKKVDENLEDSNVYYSVMDYQKNTAEGNYEGCYWTLNKLSLGNNEFQHNFIGQAFFSGRNSYEETSYFSIRKTRGGILYTIDSLEGEPVLPTFGCLDMMALWANIEHINSKEDAIKTAIK